MHAIIRCLALVAGRHRVNGVPRVARILQRLLGASDPPPRDQILMVEIRAWGSGLLLGHIAPDPAKTLYELVAEGLGDRFEKIWLLYGHRPDRVVPRGAREHGGPEPLVVCRKNFFAWLGQTWGDDQAADALQRLVHAEKMVISGSSVLSFVSGDTSWAAGDLDVYAVHNRTTYSDASDRRRRLADRGFEAADDRDYASAPGAYTACSDDIWDVTNYAFGDAHVQLITVRVGEGQELGDHVVGMYDLDYLRMHVDHTGEFVAAPRALRAVAERTSVLNLRRPSDLWRSRARIAKYASRGYATTMPTDPRVPFPNTSGATQVWLKRVVLRNIVPGLTSPKDVAAALDANIVVPYVPNPWQKKGEHRSPDEGPPDDSGGLYFMGAADMRRLKDRFAEAIIAYGQIFPEMAQWWAEAPSHRSPTWRGLTESLRIVLFVMFRKKYAWGSAPAVAAE